VAVFQKYFYKNNIKHYQQLAQKQQKISFIKKKCKYYYIKKGIKKGKITIEKLITKMQHSSFKRVE
jgi:hypothetical protein